MSDLNVTTISNSNIAKTDKLLAFNNNDSKAATIQDVVQLVPGVMAVATCSTAGNVATKAVTCADWNNKPGQSILVEFSNANSADNVTLSINNGTAIPVYYMNTATEQVSGAAIPAGAVVFTLNAAGNKFYAHVTKLIEGAGVKIDGSKIEAVNDLPTDAVLHYSFDDLPDYPDGTADVRLLDNNTYDIQSTDYQFRNNYGTTFSNENGNLKCSITGDTWSGCFILVNFIQNKIVKIRIKVTDVIGTLGVSVDAVPRGNLKAITEKGVYEVVELHPSPSGNNQLFFLCVGSGNSCTFTVEQIYIGDGSYATPVIDNANGKWNAINTGSIICKGVSGKAIKSFNNQYAPIKNDAFKMLPPYSFACWIKIKDFRENQCIIDGRDGNEGGDEGLIFRENKSIEVGASDGPFVSTSENTVSINEWAHYTVVTTIEGNDIRYKIFVNGVLEKNQAVNNTNTGFKRLSVNGRHTDVSMEKAEREVDDFLFFDRALTEKEVVALYNNKANTPKYFSKADYLLEQIANNS